jgi:hypothetical protein
MVSPGILAMDSPGILAMDSPGILAMDWPGYALPRYIAMDCPILLHVEVK